MPVRGRVRHRQASWAIGQPNVGPAFVSTAVRVAKFKQEATLLWKKFEAELGAVEKDDFLDLDASCLRLPTVKEEISQSKRTEILELSQEGPRTQHSEQRQTSGHEPTASPAGRQTRNGSLPGAQSVNLVIRSPSDEEKCADPGSQDAGVRAIGGGTGSVRGKGRGRGRGRSRGSAATTRGRKRSHAEMQQEASGGTEGVAAADLLTLPASSQQRRRVTRSSSGRLPKPLVDLKALAKAEENSDSAKEPEPLDRSQEEEEKEKLEEGEEEQQEEMDHSMESLVKRRRWPSWSPGGSNLKLPEPSVISFQGKQGRYKHENRPTKKQITGLTFGGQAKEIEQKRKQQFSDSATILESVRAARAQPLLFATPFSEHVQAPPSNFSPQPSEEPLPCDEVILRIQIREFDAHHSTLQEFLVYGSQKMTELKDAVRCVADSNMQGLGLAVHGSFFYIEGTFYTDCRGGPIGRDYVQPIQTFCSTYGIPAPSEVPDNADAFPKSRMRIDEEGVTPGRFREMNMQHSTWNDIGLRLGPGAANVYCHQGCCEHLLVVQDVRRIHPEDPAYPSAYPVVIQEDYCERRQCDICNDRMASKVTYEDKLAPTNPAFWCDSCYRQMHYDQAGKLLYNHKVFPYHSG